MDEHDHGRCSGDDVPRSMALPNGGRGSGFDYARQRIHNSFKRANDHHVVRTEYKGNNAPMTQCASSENPYTSRSKGHVSIIRVGKP